MISDDEVALWRLVVASPPVTGALEVYLDWLLTHDLARARFLRQRMQGSVLLKQWAKEEAAWVAALGLEGCEGIWFAPLPQRLTMDPGRIACLDPVLEQLPFLEVQLAFNSSDPEFLARVFASPVVGKIRSLSFRAYIDMIDPEERGVELLRVRFGNDVLAALCASPNVARLEELHVGSDELGAECARLLVAAPFVALRRLSIYGPRIGDEGAAVLAGSPVVATLRTLKLRSSEIGDAGALALASSPHLAGLEELDLSQNRIGPAGLAALRALPLRSLVV